MKEMPNQAEQQGLPAASSKTVDAFELETALILHQATNDVAQVSTEAITTFCNGVATRSLEIKQGELFVGKYHKAEHLCILLTGKIRVWQHGGSINDFKDITAPCQFIGGVGKKVALGLENSVILNVHNAVNCHNETELEAEVIYDSTDLVKLGLVGENYIKVTELATLNNKLLELNKGG